MAYVPPNSTVKLLAGVPIDSSFDHTLWFANANAQTTYFNSKAVRSFSTVSYVRKGRGVIKVEAPADQLYACNYMMFQNTSYSNKWFYAFCNVEYVNDTTSQVTFIIDPLQTWFFEMVLEQCFVVREHASHDVIGDNIIPESLETGEYIYRDAFLKTWNTWSVFITSTFHGTYNNGQWTFTDEGGSYLGNVFSGLLYKEFVISTPAGAQNAVNYISAAVNAGKQNGIVSIFMMPSNLYDYNGYSPDLTGLDIPFLNTDIDGYVPHNKKLFTYPYCLIEMNDSMGNVGVFRQEFFDQTQVPNYCRFTMESYLSSDPSIACIPSWYKGMIRAIPEAMFLKPALLCSYNTDLFKAYQAQSLSARIANDVLPMAYEGISGTANRVSEGIRGGINSAIEWLNSTLGTSFSTYPAPSYPGGSPSALASQHPDLTSALGSTAVSAAIGALTGAHESVYAELSNLYAKSVAAPQFNGSGAGDFLVSSRERGFWCYRKTIKRAFAKIIDQYFDRFGYACHEIKVPNTHVRRYWTYTKTIGCQIGGNVPSDVIEALQNIFNNGITFWADPAHFGDYTLDNAII